MLKPINSILLLALLSLLGCQERKEKPAIASGQYLTILGIAQDAGYPQVDCKKECCEPFHIGIEKKKRVTSLGLVDVTSNEKWLFDATPDITSQIDELNRNHSGQGPILSGVFLTHAHIGHYTGLMYLGKEGVNTKKSKVYAMPRMKTFLETNGPWSQLVIDENISLQEIRNKEQINLSPKLKIIPIRVPHRDEYSETIGFKIIGPNKVVLFIPDIDKWSKWETNIIDAVAQVDIALLDATFFNAEEINNRDITEIPHPFVIETMELFKDQPKSMKKKIHFIHLNHTNPLLDPASEQSKEVMVKGFKIARINAIIEL
ncbi:MAG: MBL fold metallo-hydrolase [Maribacter sp.]|nr:MBL fold metallo-hydrolase [Maribacter sp.]